MITWENYEEYIIMYADGELKPTEAGALMSFIGAHPELKKELAAYEMVKMVPDTAVVFENKDALLKKEKKVIAFPHWQRYSIAAGVAAIVFISFFKMHDTGNNEVTVAQVNTVKPAVVQQPHDTVTVPQNITQPVNNVAVTAPGATTQDIADAQPVKQNSTARQQVKDVQQGTKEDEAVKEQVIVKGIIADEMNPAGVKPLPDNILRPQAAVAVSVPALPVAKPEDTHEQSLLDKLPIDDLKKQGIEAVAAAVMNGIDKVNEIKEEINERGLTIKIQKRRLVLSF